MRLIRFETMCKEYNEILEMLPILHTFVIYPLTSEF